MDAAKTAYVRQKRSVKSTGTPGTSAFDEYSIPDLAMILCLVYLGAGFPPDPALRSAMADYLGSFPGKEKNGQEH